MSTSDAVEQRRRVVVGGEKAAPQSGSAKNAATREIKHDGEEQKNRHHDGTPTDRHSHRSATRREGTHNARTLKAEGLKKDEFTRSDEPRFSSSLLIRLSSNLGLDQIESDLQSSIDQQQPEIKNSSYQVNGGTSSQHGSLEKPNPCLLSKKVPDRAKKEARVTQAAVRNEQDLSKSRVSTNGDLGPTEHHSSRIPPGIRTGYLPGVTIEEDRKDCTKRENQTDLEKLPASPANMLSSTVVTVLAPHWGGLLRRPRKTDGTGSSDAQGNFQDPTANRERGSQESQGFVEGSMFTRGPQAPVRAQYLGVRSNTTGWLGKSDPPSMDSDSKRKLTQTVSLDVKSARVDNSKVEKGAMSPLAITESPVPPFFHEQNEQGRNSQTSNQGRLSSLSSKPTTSSLLLSLRRINTSGRNSDAPPTFSNSNPAPRSTSHDDKVFTTHLSQGFLKEKDYPKPMTPPSPLPYRTTEPGPAISPLSTDQREKNKSDTIFFSTSQKGRNTENTPMNRPQSNLKPPTPTFVRKGPLDWQQNSRPSEKSANTQSEINSLLSKQTSFDRPALQKTPSVPRATLTSTSWWKQVAKDGNSSHTHNDTASVNNMPITPLMPSSHDNRALVSSSPIDNKRLASQMPNNRDNNNTPESFFKSNMNPVRKPQGGAADPEQRHADTSPGHESDRLVKQQYGSHFKKEQPQTPYSMPDVVSQSKISKAPPQTMMSHSKDPSKHNGNDGGFNASATDLPPTFLSPKSPNTPTESNREYNNNHWPPKSPNTPTPQKNTQMLVRTPLSPDLPNTLNSLTPTSQATTGLSPTSNSKSTFSFNLNPASSQNSIQTSSSTGFSSQTPTMKFTDMPKTTPLGFERTYASIPKPFQTKTVSSLMPTVTSVSKTNQSPTCTTPDLSSTPSHPVTTTSPLFSPPVTPVITSSAASKTIFSPLTPPATPLTTNSHPETPSLKGMRTFTSSLERNPKKKRLGTEEKKARRVTWDDSVNIQSSDSIPVEKPDPPQVPTIPLSPSRSPRSTPSIFSFLRSGSPTNNKVPLCTPIPKTSSIQVEKGWKYRSLSSGSADLAAREREKNNPRTGDTAIFDQDMRSLNTPKQERTLSVESGTAQSRSSTPLSLPPDFSRNYKLRYSSPPYSSLMSSRLAQGEVKTITPRAPLFPQQQQSPYALSLNSDRVAPMRTAQPPSLPFQSTKESSKCVASGTAQVDNNLNKNNPLLPQCSQLLLVNNRVHFGSQSLQGDKTSNSCVTETLVYRIKPKVDTATGALKSTTPKPLQHTANTQVPMETKLSQQSHTAQRQEAPGEARCRSDQTSSSSSSTESQSRGSESSSNGRMKEIVLGKSRFFSVEVGNEQSPKKSRFTLKKSASTPNASLSRSESERASKTGNRMDQVFSRLKQKFSMRRSEDDQSFPWKWKKTSQTPSISGSSDISSASDISIGSTKTLEEKEMVLDDNKENIDSGDRWTQNRYTIIPSTTLGKTTSGDQFSSWSEKSAETNQHELKAGLENKSENTVQLRVPSPTINHFDFYKDNGQMDFKETNQVQSSRDPSPCRSPNGSGTYTAQYRKSTPSPRSPFSPFQTLSPLSPFPTPDTSDDNVFYSPKMQRRKMTSSPCEAVERISLGGSRKSRASTGPPSIGPVMDKERLASSYADLKYGIEPGRSFSVSSVLSSRPSGPGRISTGSRFMSVGDLSKSALSCGGNAGDLDEWSGLNDWTTQIDGQPTNYNQMPYFPSDPGKLRSRSLPRSLTRRLANWSAEASSLQPLPATTSKPARLRTPSMNICQFPWDAEGPPTPPPTPPMSPVSRRMSKPPSLSSPTFPISSGRLPAERVSPGTQSLTRGYVSSLSTFEESSDSSSDTTTDDEYFLESDEEGEKETEL